MEEQKKHESMLKEWKEKAPLAEFSKCGDHTGAQRGRDAGYRRLSESAA